MKLQIFNVYVFALSITSAAPQTVVSPEGCMMNFVWIIDEKRVSKDFEGHCVLPHGSDACTSGVSFDVHCWRSMENYFFPLDFCSLTSDDSYRSCRRPLLSKPNTMWRWK